MKKLLILQGPPASGKSTWVKEYLQDTTNPDDVTVVSRDAIRHLFGEYSMDHEDKVTIIEYDKTVDAMKAECPVIINDGTNLNPKYLSKWEELAKEYGYEVEYKQFYVPFEEAVKRDQNEDREHHVGKKVIKRVYRMYFADKLYQESIKTVDYPRIPIDKTKRRAVMCDLDGTVAWMQGRSPYDRTTVGTDKADFRMVELLANLMASGTYILFVSGREETDKCKQDTYNWIVKQFEPYIGAATRQTMDGSYKLWDLYMRCKGDYRPDEIIKKEIFEKQIKDNFDIICVFDDRDKVVDMWRENGLLCCQVNRGDF